MFKFVQAWKMRRNRAAYERGVRYASTQILSTTNIEQLNKVREQLEAEADCPFSSGPAERAFDHGIRDVLRRTGHTFASTYGF